MTDNQLTGKSNEANVHPINPQTVPSNSHICYTFNEVIVVF